jgi:hypothetical protein
MIAAGDQACGSMGILETPAAMKSNMRLMPSVARWGRHRNIPSCCRDRNSFPPARSLLRLIEVFYSFIAPCRSRMEDSQQPIIHSSYYYKGTTGVQPSPSLLGEPLTYYPSVGAGPSNTSHQIQPHFQHSIHPPYDVFSGQVPQTFAIEGHITGRFIY